jgi:2',3'-cyclic-nucleotide 2'-phosphodiesterase (5'-nucleotidase family)
MPDATVTPVGRMTPPKTAMLILRSLLLLLALVTGCASNQPDIRKLTILHTNDLHARLLPDEEGHGGFAYMAAAIREEKAKSEAALVLHAGDFVQGTPVSTIFRGEPVWEVANQLGIDINILGNHEFDYGWEQIPKFIQAAKFPTVTANLVNEQGKLLTPDPYVIREVNGIRIAVIGLITGRLDELTRSHFRGPWRALPPAETAERYAKEVRDKADLVVALGHLFNEEDDEVLRQAPDVPVLVSGHNHGGQQEVKDFEGRICVKVRAYGRELGRLDLEIDVPNKKVVSYRWQRIPIETSRYQPDPAVAALVDKWEKEVAHVVDVPIGVYKRSFDRSGTQALLETVMRQATGADLAYMNRGGVRDNLPEGEILIRHIWNIEPFGNLIEYGRVKGKDIPEEAREGRPIDPNREYTLATNDFIAQQWREKGLLDLKQEGPLVRDAMIDWVRNKKVIE